jgi:hypothetical protein
MVRKVTGNKSQTYHFDAQTERYAHPSLRKRPGKKSKKLEKRLFSKSG